MLILETHRGQSALCLSALGCKGSHEMSDPPPPSPLAPSSGRHSFILTPIRWEVLPAAPQLRLGWTPGARNLGEQTGIWQNPWYVEEAPASIVPSVSQGCQAHALLLSRFSSARAAVAGQIFRWKTGNSKRNLHPRPSLHVHNLKREERVRLSTTLASWVRNKFKS